MCIRETQRYTKKCINRYSLWLLIIAKNQKDYQRGTGKTN